MNSKCRELDKWVWEKNGKNVSGERGERAAGGGGGDGEVGGGIATRGGE